MKTRRNPLWRKIIIIVFLPVITFIWTIGWILTQIGTYEEPTEIRKKTLRTYPGVEVTDKDSKISDENDKKSRTRYEQEIFA